MFVLVSMGLLRLPPVENVTSHVANEYDSSVSKYRMFFCSLELGKFISLGIPLSLLYKYSHIWCNIVSIIVHLTNASSLQLTSFINYVE